MNKLTADKLRWQPDAHMLETFKNPQKLEATTAIVGQKRAIEALELGIKLQKTGFNIYVSGMSGTGRVSTIRRALEQTKITGAPPPDRCYVYNFVNASEPLLLTFEPGRGRTFRDDMAEFVRVLRAEVPKAIEAPHVQREREMLVDRYQREEKKLFEEFAEQLKKEEFALIQVQEGGYVAPTVFPIIGKEAVSIDFLDNLVREGKMTEEERNTKFKRHKILSGDLKHVLTKARALGKEMHQALDRLVQHAASLVLDGLMDDLRARYKGEKVRKYLLRMKSHILQHIDAFAGKKENSPQQEGLIVIGGGQQRQEDQFWYYEVNLLYDQSAESTEEGCAPIVEEHNPSFTNFFGAIEYNVAPGGYWSTDFRHIKAGSLLRADGGFIIINAMDILRRPMVWDQLKRVLRTEELVIQQPETYFQMAPLAIKPEPIDLNVTVIMIGPTWLYRALYSYEEDFPKTFKVLADFDTTMKLTTDSAHEYAQVLKAVVERGELLPLDCDGLIAMVEHGIEEAGQQERISTRFAYITDILREADHWAREEKAKGISGAHVERALEAKRNRHRLSEEHVQRLIEEGIILIDSQGSRVGQVNGLSVYSMGHASFGKPSRVTATTSVGKGGVINVEREAKLSGPIHDKGILILTGFLRQKYAQREPLNLTASLCFEQSYGGVDGDSASSTEIYALLSSLGNIPLRQDVAVTGSVNQLGDIQPIGGANEKIAGFFDVCKAQGLTGTQGVIIPVQNERHLMLRRDVVEAVERGQFHIWSVTTIDEGIELLTGMPAGKMRSDRTYPKDTVHGRVTGRLKEMNELIAAMSGGTLDEKKPKKKSAPRKKATPKKPAAKKRVSKKTAPKKRPIAKKKKKKNL